ncbi:MAG: CdaR family protein [Deltaproteobacteria bacterium]
MKLEFNKKTIISFIPFVFLAVLFWASTILNRQNTHTKEIWLKLLPPTEMVLLTNSMVKASLTIEGEGFKLLFINSPGKNKPIPVNVSSDDKSLSKEKVLLSLKKHFNEPGIKIIDIVFPEKKIKMDKKISRNIPVRLISKLEFDKDFGLQAPPLIHPETVKVTGPKSIVDTIKVWQTELLHVQNLNKTVKSEIPLKNTNAYTDTDKKTISVTLRVEGYAEKKIKLPVNIEGPGKDKFEVFPKYIEISAELGLSKYDLVQPDDFSASAYINENMLQNEKIPVSIVRKPMNVNIKFLNPDFVDVVPKLKN